VHRGLVDHDLVTALGLRAEPADTPSGVPGVPGVPGVVVTVPLATPVGYGVLALVAPQEPPVALVQAFAERAARAVAAAHAYEERATLAHTLRESLVPAPLPAIAGIELGAAYRPAQETTQIGGDFYDVTPCPDGRWAVSIGDVCGKGVEAAVLTGQVRQSLRTASLVTDDPGAVLHLLNETLRRTDGTTFATVAFGVLDAAPGRTCLRLSAGGHPQPLLLRDGTVRALPTRGTLIGMLPEVSFDVLEVALRPEDVVLLYTDGAADALGPTGVLGGEAIEAVLADSAGMRAQAITDRVLQLALEHVQSWPHDDIALLALRVLPQGTG
jgi:serine phosphatase RsbU (regulator of sigma subunit)